MVFNFLLEILSSIILIASKRTVSSIFWRCLLRLFNLSEIAKTSSSLSEVNNLKPRSDAPVLPAAFILGPIL